MSFDLATSTLTALNTIRLNPFRSGQCLSTEIFEKVCEILESQSLSFRAMSFDGVNHGKD